MGISSDGIICFGVDLGSIEEEGLELPWSTPESREDEDEGESQSFEDWLHKLAGDAADTSPYWNAREAWIREQGGDEPTMRYDERRALGERFDAEHPLIVDAYHCALEKQRDVEKACPVELVTHCSYDYSMWIVAIRGTEVRASRGYPKPIDWPELDARARDLLPAAHAFCREHGIPFEEPGWILTSVYG